MPWDKIYVPRAVGHALMSSPDVWLASFQMLKTLKENDKSEDEIKGWQEAAKLATTKFILPNFDDFEFYIGKSVGKNL